MRERLRVGKAEQERRAQQAACRADEIWSVSSSQMRKAERVPREALYRAEMLKWRIEGGGLRPRRPRSLELGGARRKPFLTRSLSYCTPLPLSLPSIHPRAWQGLSPKFMRGLRNLYQKATIDLLQRGRAARGLRRSRASAPPEPDRGHGG
jgi:hypothetical protein